MVDAERSPSVCVDGYNIAMPKGTGIATYGRNLLSNLKIMGMTTSMLAGPQMRPGRDSLANESAVADNGSTSAKTSKFELLLRTWTSRFGQVAYPVPATDRVEWPAGRKPDADHYWVAPSLYRFANRSFSHYGSETPLAFAGDDQATAPDVMHWTAVLPLHAQRVANIYTIHDLIPLRLPHLTTDDVGQFMRLCKAVVARADHIAVVSEATRRDVIDMLGVSEDRVTNTYQSVDIPQALQDRPSSEVAAELEAMFGLGWKEYFLHFGAIEPKKNLGRIVEGYLASGASSPLVLVGGKAWMSEDETMLLEHIQRDGGEASRKIRQYEYLPFSILINLIRGAKATLFPSLFEGFGLPVLESMTLGTAVLTSTAGSLPEIVGDAGVCVDPYDVQALAAAIRTLDNEDGMIVDMVRRGLDQSAQFSAVAYRRRLSALYEKVA